MNTPNFVDDLSHPSQDGDEPVFQEPWQAQAFALTVTMNQQGLFSWSEWAEFLSQELHGTGAKEDGSDYYDHWLCALEKIVISKGITDMPQIANLASSWQRAAHATPHGKAIKLENDPQAASADLNAEQDSS